MALLREIKAKARQVAPPVAAACMVAYFAYHAVQGDRGLIAWLHLKAELAQARAVEADLAAERAVLERRVALLRPDNLDPDLLAERAHALLNYGRDDEVVIILERNAD